MKPHVITSAKQWIALRQSSLRDQNIGVVPTMGALHDGHLSLALRSKGENDVTLVSIFVNPTQFNDPGDLKNYPQTFDEDMRRLESVGADYVLSPTVEDLYADDYRYRITESKESTILCGAHRPGHFDGVLTVVMKLLNIVGAQRAYFGEKDYQQLLLIKGMADAFFLPTEIIGCPTVREPDGLAMSSRNALLSPEARRLAPEFPKLLRNATTVEETRSGLEASGFKVEYVEEQWGRRFGAVYLGNVRLIDNVRIHA